MQEREYSFVVEVAHFKNIEIKVLATSYNDANGKIAAMFGAGARVTGVYQKGRG